MSITKKLLYTLSAGHRQLFFLSLLAIAISSLAFAYFVEYVLGFEPCILCLYQRVPYLLLTLVTISALILKKHHNYLLIATTVILLCSICLAAYHTGIERGFISPSSTCNGGITIPDGASADEIRELLYAAPIAACTRAAIKILGVSMTEWNLILSIGLFTVNLLVIKRK
jgi:disulfide bond formation protein DsbB